MIRMQDDFESHVEPSYATLHEDCHSPSWKSFLKDGSSQDNGFETGSCIEKMDAKHIDYVAHQHTTETPVTSSFAPASKSALVMVQIALPMSKAEFMSKEHLFINAIGAAAGQNVTREDIFVKEIKKGPSCTSLKSSTKQAKFKETCKVPKTKATEKKKSRVKNNSEFQVGKMVLPLQDKISKDKCTGRGGGKKAWTLAPPSGMLHVPEKDGVRLWEFILTAGQRDRLVRLQAFLTQESLIVEKGHPYLGACMCLTKEQYDTCVKITRIKITNQMGDMDEPDRKMKETFSKFMISNGMNSVPCDKATNAFKKYVYNPAAWYENGYRIASGGNNGKNKPIIVEVPLHKWQC